MAAGGRFALDALQSVTSCAWSEIRPYRTQVVVASALATVWAIWASGPGPTAPALVVAACGGAALGVIDAHTHRLPNALSYPTTVTVAVLLLLAATASGDFPTAARAGLGGLGLTVGFLLLHLINPKGLGFGDVKLAALVGLVSAWFGWTTFWSALLVTFLLGGLVALALLLARRATRTTAIALGPFMLIGTAAAVTGTRLFG
ncbi:MAG: prepilin peptidase [Beutenbergiaceae bacterium]